MELKTELLANWFYYASVLLFCITALVYIYYTNIIPDQAYKLCIKGSCYTITELSKMNNTCQAICSQGFNFTIS